MKTLITNCPNCGAELNEDGFCSYCETKIRYANELELSMHDLLPERTEVLMKFNKTTINENGEEIKETILMPMSLYLENVELDTICDYSYVRCGSLLKVIPNNNPTKHCKLTFDAYIGKELR
jgi:hypothetical protein